MQKKFYLTCVAFQILEETGYSRTCVVYLVTDLYGAILICLINPSSIFFTGLNPKLLQQQLYADWFLCGKYQYSLISSPTETTMLTTVKSLLKSQGQMLCFRIKWMMKLTDKVNVLGDNYFYTHLRMALDKRWMFLDQILNDVILHNYLFYELFCMANVLFFTFISNLQYIPFSPSSKYKFIKHIFLSPWQLWNEIL